MGAGGLGAVRVLSPTLSPKTGCQWCLLLFKDSNHPYHLLPWVWCHQHGSGGAAEGWQEGPGSLGEAGAASVPADCCKAALLACKAASSWAIVKQGTFFKKTYVVCFKLLIDYCLYDYI